MEEVKKYVKPSKKSKKDPYKKSISSWSSENMNVAELGRRNDSWENFIGQNKFNEQPNEMVAGNQVT
jgi:hypothetical protein